MVIKRLLCEIFDRHKPIYNISINNEHMHSFCKYCGRKIMLNSKGYWVGLDKEE